MSTSFSFSFKSSLLPSISTLFKLSLLPSTYLYSFKSIFALIDLFYFLSISALVYLLFSDLSISSPIYIAFYLYKSFFLCVYNYLSLHISFLSVPICLSVTMTHFPSLTFYDYSHSACAILSSSILYFHNLPFIFHHLICQFLILLFLYTFLCHFSFFNPLFSQFNLYLLSLNLSVFDPSVSLYFVVPF